MKKLALVIVLAAMFCLVLTMSGCSDNFKAFLGIEDEFIEPDSSLPNPTANITFTYTDDEGNAHSYVLTYELHYDKAPITVMNFIELAKSGFYDGTLVHRTASISSTAYSTFNYVEMGLYKLYQASDEETANKDLLEKKTIDYMIKGEFKANDWEKNTLLHEFGALGMTRTSGADNFDTASASFYMCLSTNETRNGNYALFATLTSEFPEAFFQDIRIPSTVSIEIVDTELFQQVPKFRFTIDVDIVDNGIDYGSAPHIG
ncbi:MAG: peptidylprolyl isomerase [Clostridia bacterium]|nr:peptidylprolyl isomerase [Clostridia bacterium]